MPGQGVPIVGASKAPLMPKGEESAKTHRRRSLPLWLPLVTLLLLLGGMMGWWRLRTPPNREVENPVAHFLTSRPTGKESATAIPPYHLVSGRDTPLPTAGDAMLGITIWRLRRVTPADLRFARELRFLSHDPQMGGEVEWILERVPVGTIFSPGDRIRLSVESARGGYLYVVDRERYRDGTTGVPYLVFPLTSFRKGENFVGGGEIVEIPSREAEPKFFTLSPAPERPDQTGEILTFLVTPHPLDIERHPRPFELDPDTFAQWQQLGRVPIEHYEMGEDAEGRWRLAGEEGIPMRRLTLDTPPPQSIYHAAAGKEAPFLVEVEIRYTP